MAGPIYLMRENGELVEMAEKSYDSENLLQKYLAQYPKLLAGGQSDVRAPRDLLLVRREMPVPSEEGGAGLWSVDLLFLDRDGVPTIVEVKKASSREIRRQIVGQILEYAANAVVYWPIEAVRAEFEAFCASQEVEPERLIAEALGENVDPEELWQKVKTNLQAGRVRLIIVSDEIPPELRRIVEFLNSQMDPTEMLAVEVRQFVGEGLKTLVPTTVGQTVASQRKSGVLSKAKQWDEQSFFEQMAAMVGTDDVEVARRLLAWAK